MKRADNTLYNIIKDADNRAKITTLFDLLQLVTLEELSGLAEIPTDDIVRWVMNTGTMPEDMLRKFSSYVELPYFVVEQMFGIPRIGSIQGSGRE